jgi:hypothetical protein
MKSQRHPKLQCRWRAWRVIRAGELALDMPADNCTDMGGAIEIATVLCPGVRRIATFADGKPDTEYRLVGGQWRAFLHAIP